MKDISFEEFFKGEFLKGVFPIFGIYDSLIKFFRKILYFCVKNNANNDNQLIIDFIMMFTKNDFQEYLLNLATDFHQHLNLSIKGTVDFLGFLCEIN